MFQSDLKKLYDYISKYFVSSKKKEKYLKILSDKKKLLLLNTEILYSDGIRGLLFNIYYKGKIVYYLVRYLETENIHQQIKYKYISNENTKESPENLIYCFKGFMPKYKKELKVFEGIIDYIILGDINDSISILGKINDYKLKKIFEYDKIIFYIDNDEGGINILDRINKYVIENKIDTKKYKVVFND